MTDDVQRGRPRAALDRVAQLVKAARERSGLSQAELAAAIGVHLQTINRYERGRLPITLPRLSAIAEALGIPAAEVGLDLNQAAFVRSRPESQSERIVGSHVVWRHVGNGLFERNIPDRLESAPHATEERQAVREWLARFRLELTKIGASDTEIELAVRTVSAPQLRDFFLRNVQGGTEPELTLLAMERARELCVLPDMQVQAPVNP